MKELISYHLLIWQLVPEEVKLYMIPSHIGEEYTSYLEQAHGKLINGNEMNPGLQFLNTALSEEKGFAEAGFEKYEGIFVEYEADTKEPISHNRITRVYLSGFIL
jgi:hypothetical protein